MSTPPLGGAPPQVPGGGMRTAVIVGMKADGGFVIEIQGEAPTIAEAIGVLTMGQLELKRRLDAINTPRVVRPH